MPHGTHQAKRGPQGRRKRMQKKSKKHVVTVRPAKAEDAEALVRFARAMARETEGKALTGTVEEGVRALLDTPRYGFYLVAEVDGARAGALMVTYEWSDWRGGLLWWIQSVYVRPAYRRRGVFAALYEATRARAEADAEVCGLRLYVEKDNRAARKTYEALGMKATAYRLYETFFTEE